MADTVRTEVDLLKRIQKQMPFGREGDTPSEATKGQVIPQDLRDLIVTLFDAAHPKGYAAITMESDTPATAQQLATGVPEVLEGWDTSFAGNQMTPAHATGTITVVNAGDYTVTAEVSFSLAGPGELGWRIYVNGLPVGPHMHDAVLGGTLGMVAVSFMGTLAADDVISLYVESLTVNELVTVYGATLKAERKG